MNFEQAETLVNANVEHLLVKASNPNALLASLDGKISNEIARLEAVVAAGTGLSGSPDAEPHRRTLAKLDAIIAKAKGDGRADLAAAAGKKRAATLAAIEAIETTGAEGDMATLTAQSYLDKLRDKLVEVQTRRAEAGLGEPSQDGDLGTFSASEIVGDETLDALATPEPDWRPGDKKKGPPKAAAAPESADGVLDDEFAALFADMDPAELAAIEKKMADKHKKPDDDDDDDGMAGLDLVEVADDELPDGADVESDEPIDFSSLDDIAPGAKKPAPAKAKTGKAPAKPAEAKPAAKKKGDAKKGDAGADKDAEAGGGSKAIWYVVAATGLSGATALGLYFAGVF